ncbi:MAG TPA: hypothetical protein VLA84_01150 [Microcoleus sp.]|nr:hypothetical protein [Microcoleus sp.]
MPEIQNKSEAKAPPAKLGESSCFWAIDTATFLSIGLTHPM